MASLVLPEYHPTLREELARLAPATRRVLAGGLALLVLALIAWSLRPAHEGVRYVHEGDPTFNLRYGAAFQRVAPGPGEYLRIRRRAHGRVVDSFSVARLALPPYRGDVNGLLPVYAVQVLSELRAAHPGLRVVEEGKARVNTVAGYSILFRTGHGRGRMYGREVLLPEPAQRASAQPTGGVRMALRTFKGSGVGRPRALGTKGALRIPFRSFRYGTEAP